MGTSTTNIGTTSEETRREETFTTQRPNPVALEVPVTITGARISEKAAGRDLFTEETKTVLVFRDGHKTEAVNYAIVGQTLWIYTETDSKKMPLADLDVAATKSANSDRGVTFQVPPTK